MKVLIACEFSGVVRRAFRVLGHDAWSCDLLPAEDASPYHVQGDATAILTQGWDLLIAHPPCTFLCNSGVRWLVSGGVLDPSRHGQMQQACDLFAAFWHAPVPHIAIENPVMHRYAREYLASKGVPFHACTIQPWEHGHGEIKRTCFWLKGLPPLVPTNIVSGRIPRVHHASPGPDRWKERSRTLEGVAKAMALQWGGTL